MMRHIDLYNHSTSKSIQGKQNIALAQEMYISTPAKYLFPSRFQSYVHINYFAFLKMSNSGQS